MDKVALHLVVCCLAVMCFLSTSVIGCGKRPSGECTHSECDQGTCVQIDDYITRECASRDELRRFVLPLPEPAQLFRVLRPEEDPSFGLVAKDISGSKSYQSHVGCGGRPNYKSQFISTAATLQAALNWASLTRNRASYRISIINVACLKLHGIEIKDLRNPTILELPGRTARNFATHYQEVLVKKKIPAECIVATYWYSSTSRNDLC